MQNSVSEGVPFEASAETAAPLDNNMTGFAVDAPAFSYDEVFPALPQNMTPTIPSSNQLGKWNKMRVGSSTVTQVFVIPYEERRLDYSEKFGESESMRVCTNIMQATGALIEISNSKDQSLTFLVTGKTSSVLDARRRILSYFQMQAVVKLPIPKEHHRHLLGKNGQKLKELEKNTACTIKIPARDDPSDLISISGPKEGMEKAIHEIKVTSDEQSKQAKDRVTVPKKYHPFICGAHNARLTELMERTRARINVPPPSVMSDEIVITGEKEGVLLAKTTIMEIYLDMEEKCNSVSVEVPKHQHRYVIGVRGTTIAEILEETGVSVEMPPAEADTDTITLRGPQDGLGKALTKVYEKANSVTSTKIAAPNWIHKYIIGKQGTNMKKLNQELTKVHVEFAEDNCIKIEGPAEEVNKAKEKLEQSVKENLDSMSWDEVKVDPKFYKHIIGKGGSNVNRLKDEHGVMINIVEDDGTGANIIRLEGKPEGVACVRQELLDMVSRRENEKEGEVAIDHRYYPNIIGSKGERIREIKDMFNQVQIFFPNSSEKRDVVRVRGPREDVEKCCLHLKKRVEEISEESHIMEVPVYKHFHKFIIGKEGTNIRKIRDDTHTKIDLPNEGDKSDIIRITGRKENVERARDLITKIQNEMGNTVLEEMTIPPKFYNSLIGTGGKLIHSISFDCGGVQIKFPNAESKSDKVTIRGPKEDVDRAKQQLEELTNDMEAASFTAEVKAKHQYHKFLIGKSGVNIRKIREQTGARITFPSDQDEDKETIVIIGKKDQVELAKLELERTIRDIDNTIESEMTVPLKHHRYFVARRGAVINNITDECGGVTISFPRPNVDSDKVKLKGPKDCIELAKKRIEEVVQDLDSMVTIECVIPQRHHRTVMGPKGAKLQCITSDYSVQIKFPDRETVPIEEFNNHEDGSLANGEESPRTCDIIRITGKLQNCEDAKAALLQLVPITIKVPVAFNLHRSIIGKAGSSVRQLMDDFDVHIILSPPDQRQDWIEVTGAPANVENAKTALEERVRQLELDREDKQRRSFQLSVTVDPEYHPKIIGRKGAVISKIRDDFGVAINLPKRGDPEEHIITITGYEDKAIAARDHILSIVDELKDRSKEEIVVDSRVHSRLIGQKGRVIRKLMDDFRVDIKFPRQGDANPDLVVIMGAHENVQDAKEKILNLAEEYMMEVQELEQLQSYQRPSANITEANAEGFIVRGGPWEQQNSQRRPDTASIEEFPTFGGAPGLGEGPQMMSWGPRR